MVHGEQKLPDGWQWTTLGKIANYINGRAFKPTEWEITGRPIIRIQNLTGSTGTLNRFSGEVEPKYIIRDGDLLISWSATLGAFIYRGEEAVLNQHIFKVEPFINKKFLYYLVTAYLNTLKRQVHGSGMQHITKGKFDNSPVPLPPPDEQEGIVAKIEELFTQLEAGTSALERVRAGLRRYEASVLKAAVEGKLLGNGKVENSELPEGWRWATVEELAADEKYSLAIGPFGSNLKVVDYRDEGVPLVFVRHIRTANFDETHYVTKEKAEELKAHQIAGGDALITKMGEPPGDACLYPESKPMAVITADCIKWRVAEDLADKRFIVHAINSSVMQKQIQKITRGVAQKKVSLDRFRGLSVPLPPLEEQRRIVAEVERRLSVARQVESAVEGALVRASRLRQAVLRSAFEGRLGS